MHKGATHKAATAAPLEERVGRSLASCADEPVTDYHRQVDAFKKDLLERTLRAHAGNRTHAANALGLQRTYLLRLIRAFEIYVPIQQRYRRNCYLADKYKR